MPLILFILVPSNGNTNNNNWCSSSSNSRSEGTVDWGGEVVEHCLAVQFSY